MLGLGCGRLISERFQKTLMMACAVAVIFLGLTGAVKEMLALDGGGLALVGTNCMLASLIGGALIGEAINIEDRMEKFGIWLRRKTGSSGDTRFVDGFVTTSLTVCIGAMGVVGSINDRLLGDPSVLFAKTVLDAVIVMIMTATLGKGCIFSALSVEPLRSAARARRQLPSRTRHRRHLGACRMIAACMSRPIGAALLFYQILS